MPRSVAEKGLIPICTIDGARIFWKGGRNAFRVDTEREANTNKVASLRQEIKYRTLRARRVSFRKAMRLHSHRGIDNLANPETIF